MFEDLNFKFNRDQIRMESDNPEIYVEDRKYMPPQCYFKLFWEEREILFMAVQHIAVNEEGVEEIAWELLSVRSPDPGTGSFNYKNLEEMQDATRIMLSFLAQYDGHFNSRLTAGTVKIASVKLNDDLQTIINL